MPPADFNLPAAELHVWQIPRDVPEKELARLEGLLSAGERERAGRFHFERDRRRFVAGRGALRLILAAYLQREPAEVSFDTGPRGKPAVAGDSPHFNLAHSDALAVLAVTRAGPVGVDIERIRPMDDLDRLVQRCFSAAERAELAALPAEDRLRGFFTGWVRKEAFLKAAGVGLAMPLDGFDVPLRPGSPPCLLRLEGEPLAPAAWSFHDLLLPGDYLGAAACRGRIESLRHRTWAP